MKHTMTKQPQRISCRLFLPFIMTISGIMMFAFIPLHCGEDENKYVRPLYSSEYCAFYLTGEMDAEGLDGDGDGISNGWDVCPNNPKDWLDSDRDGIGNLSDSDMDGDGIPNELDTDMDGDGFSNNEEIAADTNPKDPSSIPGLPAYQYDQGILNPLPGWYKGDFHVHTNYSHDGYVSVEYWINEAERIGLDFLTITDHRNVDHLFDDHWNSDQLLLISGIEWGGGGHANMFGLRTDNTCNYDDYESIKQSWQKAFLQGAAQSLNHYGDDTGYWDPLLANHPDLIDRIDTMEVWNVWWNFSPEQNLLSIGKWEEWLNNGHKIAAIGGSDTHYTAFPVAFPMTFVYAENLSQLAILEGLRQGRTYITNSYPYFDENNQYNHKDVSILTFEADANNDGQYEATIGDSVPLTELHFHIIVENAYGPIQVIKNKEVLLSLTGHSPGTTAEYFFMDTPDSYSWYRIEMRNSGTNGEMLLFSSPIYAE